MAKPGRRSSVSPPIAWACAPEACVFVDDWDKNVDAARAVGMQAVLHRVDKGDDLRAQLAALGVAPGA